MEYSNTFLVREAFKPGAVRATLPHEEVGNRAIALATGMWRPDKPLSFVQYEGTVRFDCVGTQFALARQQRILARHGVVVTPQTLWDQVFALGKRLAPTAEALFQHALSHPVIGLDQTGGPKLEGKDEKPWQMWCVTVPGIVCHKIRDDKGADTFRELLGNYRGVVVCDALKTHEAGARGNDQIQLAGCWAHVFRKFEEALPNHPDAQLALDWIGQLYAIDERAGPGAESRALLRKTESTAVLAELKAWLWTQAVLKTLSMGKAAAYTIANSRSPGMS